jgi:hypothetical protein
MHLRCREPRLSQHLRGPLEVTFFLLTGSEKKFESLPQALDEDHDTAPSKLSGTDGTVAPWSHLSPTAPFLANIFFAARRQPTCSTCRAHTDNFADSTRAGASAATFTFVLRCAVRR